ncbi:hypothetical protein GFV12_01315 [Desulfurobacterium thermolithotrophum]|uniref:hypothetical protein n=1 Tax=Desulfurobacterium thermolithotrophum TaxID=64160 RepID=UPI0013D65AE9|nr:hypothetical protein [Desulfurobacterium thermolithotrophum]
MDDSFSILKLDKKELCSLAEERGQEIEIAHYVFDDLLDSQEKLICKRFEADEDFSIFSYFLQKESRSIFPKKEEKSLGCYIAYKNGVVYTFEDFNFKIQSLEEFTLLVEAVEIATGNTFFFELCNLCELPERLSSEHTVRLSLYSKEVRKLEPLIHFDQIADEHKEILKLAVKNNDKAIEKLERDLGERETQRLIDEFKSKPEEIFDTYIFSRSNNYSVVGVVTFIKKVTFESRELFSINIIAEDMELNVLTPIYLDLTDGDRIFVNGKMFGIVNI